MLSLIHVAPKWNGLASLVTSCANVPIAEDMIGQCWGVYERRAGRHELSDDLELTDGQAWDGLRAFESLLPFTLDLERSPMIRVVPA